MNTIQTARKNIQRNLECLIEEMLEQYAVWGNKYFAMLKYNRTKGLHYGLRITNGSFAVTFKLVHYIEDELRKLQAEKPSVYGEIEARAFVEEMENLSDKIVDMDD